MAFMIDEGALIVEDGDVIDIHSEDFLPFCAVVSLEEWLTIDYAKRWKQEGLFITVASRRCAYFLNKKMIKPRVSISCDPAANLYIFSVSCVAYPFYE